MDHLYRALEPVVGRGGFQVLFGGALVRTAQLHPELEGLEVPEAGPPAPEQLEEILGDVPRRDREWVATALLSELLSFLARLVGWGFTLAALRDRWPEVASRYEEPALRKLLDDS